MLLFVLTHPERVDGGGVGRFHVGQVDEGHEVGRQRAGGPVVCRVFLVSFGVVRRCAGRSGRERRRQRGACAEPGCRLSIVGRRQLQRAQLLSRAEGDHLLGQQEHAVPAGSCDQRGGRFHWRQRDRHQLGNR